MPGVSFNSETRRWSILGEAGEVRRSDARKAILDVLAIATNMKRNAVDQRLRHILRDGDVVQLGRGRYAHPDKVDLLKRGCGSP